MIHPSGTFEYEAEFTSDSFSASDIVVRGTLMRNINVDRLVGPSPTIRFWDDRVILFASDESSSRLRNTSFWIGNAVSLSAEPGDRLYIVRTGSGGLGLSVLRQDRLVIALGAVTAVPLGTDVNVAKHPKTRTGFAKETWLEFHVGNEQSELSEREITEIDDYQIYVEHCWIDGIPGTDECVSICVANNPSLNLGSLRAAVILAHSDVKLTHWDGTERFIHF